MDGPDQSQLKHAVYEAHTQRELEGTFLRLGYFTPGSGLTRQIRTFGASPDTTVGIMYGSSDSLVIDQAKPGVYPVYVSHRQSSGNGTNLPQRPVDQFPAGCRRFAELLIPAPCPAVFTKSRFAWSKTAELAARLRS